MLTCSKSAESELELFEKAIQIFALDFLNNPHFLPSRFQTLNKYVSDKLCAHQIFQVKYEGRYCMHGNSQSPAVKEFD